MNQKSDKMLDGVKRCMRAKPFPLDNWTQNGNTYICTDSLLFNKPYTIKKINNKKKTT
jgi:hypothetical protein